MNITDLLGSLILKFHTQFRFNKSCDTADRRFKRKGNNYIKMNGIDLIIEMIFISYSSSGMCFFQENASIYAEIVRFLAYNCSENGNEIMNFDEH